MTDERLNEIAAREQKAARGPWHNAGGDVRDEGCITIAEVCDAVPWRRSFDEEWTDEESEAGRKMLPATEIVASAEFIAESRQDIPELLAEVNRLRLALEAAQADSARLDVLFQFMLHDGSESDASRENGISLHRPTEAETSGWRIYGFEGWFISKGESPRAAIDSLLAVVRSI